MRFVLTYPVDDGEQFYLIADVENNITVVSVSNTVPNAEAIARMAWRVLNKIGSLS